MKYLRKALEFGFSATILSTVLLTACGGGGGSAAVTTGGTPVTLTPVKGKFQGSCAVSVMNASGVVVPNTVQAINANGTTNITLPVGTTGPYLVSITGAAGNTCQYFNDDYANPQLLTLLPTQSLNALLTNNEITSASGVAITALTEMAFQAASAVNGGSVSGITDTSAALHQGRAAAVTLVGLTGASAVASIFTPPAVIPASGAAPSDDMGNALVNIANLNGANPMNAVNLMSIYAASATLATTASGVPAAYASAVAALPPSYVGQGAAFASQVAVAMPTARLNVTAAAAAVSYFAEISTSGVRAFFTGVLSPTQNYPAMGYLTTGTLSNAVYTFTRTWNHLINGVWTPANSGYYILGNAGWIDSSTLPMTMTLNPDGSIRKTVQGYTVEDVSITKFNWAGVTMISAVMNLNANGQTVLNASGVPTMSTPIAPIAFATGAASYYESPFPPVSFWSAITQDLYEVLAGNGGVGVNFPATDILGTDLTTLPVAGTPFCANKFTYYRPGVTASTYDLFATTGTCAAPAVGAVPYQTVTAATVTVNGTSLMEFTAPNGGVTFLAVINGKAYVGVKTPIGGALNTFRPIGRFSSFNSTATQQKLNAMNLPLF